MSSNMKSHYALYERIFSRLINNDGGCVVAYFIYQIVADTCFQYVNALPDLSGALFIQTVSTNLGLTNKVSAKNKSSVCEFTPLIKR